MLTDNFHFLFHKFLFNLPFVLAYLTYASDRVRQKNCSSSERLKSGRGRRSRTHGNTCIKYRYRFYILRRRMTESDACTRKQRHTFSQLASHQIDWRDTVMIGKCARIYWKCFRGSCFLCRRSIKAAVLQMLKK